MIVKKKWVHVGDKFGTSWTREGYYLFGILPLFIRDTSTRIKFHATRVSC